MATGGTHFVVHLDAKEPRLEVQLRGIYANCDFTKEKNTDPDQLKVIIPLPDLLELVDHLKTRGGMMAAGILGKIVSALR